MSADSPGSVVFGLLGVLHCVAIQAKKSGAGTQKGATKKRAFKAGKALVAGMQTT